METKKVASNIVFDTESSGLWKKGWSDLDPRMPHVASIAAVGYDDDLNELWSYHKLVRPDGWVMPEEASKINGLQQAQLEAEGVSLKQVFDKLEPAFKSARVHAAYNVAYDARLLRIEALRLKRPEMVQRSKAECLMLSMAGVIREPGPYGDFRWVKLREAFKHCYGVEFENQHDALSDVRATSDVWRYCRYKGWVGF